MAKKPDLELILATEYQGRGGEVKTRYTRFGALWQNKNGVGYNGQVDFFPVGAGTRIMLMPPKAETAAAGDLGDCEAGEEFLDAIAGTH